MAASTGKRPNLLLVAVDSLRRDHMSLYGYHRLTTPHVARFAEQGTMFRHPFSPSVPTTPAYASMLTGRDCFGTGVVGLRHKDDVAAPMLPEILEKAGYATCCIGFPGNPASRGFQTYLEYEGWGEAPGAMPKAHALNQVAIPYLRTAASASDPFFLFLRHMDPHSPYLPPAPFDRLFYEGDEHDPANRSLDRLYAFAPFADYFRSWFPGAVTDARFIDSLYDGAVAYMDAAIGRLFTALDDLGLADNTVVVFTADHGETLNEHDCWYDHHGLYDPNLVVPLIIRAPGKVPAGLRVDPWVQTKDMAPTMLELLGVDAGLEFDGRSLLPLARGEPFAPESELYLTEATWMRKHGWRTPEWKLIRALEPDFHFKPEVELYQLVRDPEELDNVAEREPGVVALLEERMAAHAARREAESDRRNPMFTQLGWHGTGDAPFASSEEAYRKLRLGSRKQAQRLQARSAAEHAAGRAKEDSSP